MNVYATDEMLLKAWLTLNLLKVYYDAEYKPTENEKFDTDIIKLMENLIKRNIKGTWSSMMRESFPFDSLSMEWKFEGEGEIPAFA